MGQCEIRPFEHVSGGAVPVRGFLHAPNASCGKGLLLTHGAGANCQSPLLIALANEFCSAGLSVLRCDLTFRQSRPHGPPPRGSAERDQQGLRAAMAALRRLIAETASPCLTNVGRDKGTGPGGMFLGGHSYGGRQATMLAASEPGLADGLLLLSYPLHPPRRPAELRTAHFPDLRTPALFVHGTRDGFGSIDEMALALRSIAGSSRLLAIEGAGHELMTKRNRNDLPKMVTEAFLSFLATQHDR